jgi:DNA-binding MarR family transcriptional regulator
MAYEPAERWSSAWLALVRTHARLWDQLETGMRRDSGLTMSRYDVLTQLDLAGGRLRLSELASAIVLSPSGLSKLLDRMEAAGLLRREPDPSDARSTFARITPQGRKLVRKARRSHRAWLESTFAAALDDRDLRDLDRILKRIDGQSWNPMPASPNRDAYRPV